VTGPPHRAERAVGNSRSAEREGSWLLDLKERGEGRAGNRTRVSFCADAIVDKTLPEPMEEA